jgi:hypothetical protein
MSEEAYPFPSPPRSGIQAFARRGDIFWNVAVGSSDNTGRLIYDGKHLQELQVLWDSVGHLPVSS